MHIRMFVSPAGGVGKTTTVVNLALHLDRMGQRVLCIDANPDSGLMRAIFSGDFDRSTVRTLPGSNVQAAFSGFSFESASFDWVLIDAPSRLPAAELIPPKAQLVVCTDASTYSLSLLEVFLDNLAELRKKANFVVHRLLLSRVSLLSETQRNHVQRLRRLGVRRMQETVLWQDELFASQADLPLVAPSGTPLFRSHAQLALEWLLETAEPKIAFGNTSDDAPLARQIDRLQLPADSIPTDIPAFVSPGIPASASPGIVASTRQDLLDSVLRTSLMRGRFHGMALADASGLLLSSVSVPMDHDKLGALVATLTDTLDRIARISPQQRSEHITLDISFSDKLVLRTFPFRETVLCLVVFCPQETDERDEMELTVGSVLSVLHQPGIGGGEQ